MVLWPVLLLLATQSTTAQELKRRCHGADTERVSGSFINPPIFDDANKVPFQVLFLFDQSVKMEDQAALEQAGVVVNQRLGDAVKASPLVETKISRIKSGDACLMDLSCGGKVLPEEHVLPCPLGTPQRYSNAAARKPFRIFRQAPGLDQESETTPGKESEPGEQGEPGEQAEPMDGPTSNDGPEDDQQYLAETANGNGTTPSGPTSNDTTYEPEPEPEPTPYTLVVFVYTDQDDKECKDHYTRRETTTCQGANWDHENAGRPSHGMIVLCQLPPNAHKEYLVSILLHQTIHIMLWDFTVAGMGTKACTDNDKTCEEKTLTHVEQSWKTEDGRNIKKTLHLIKTQHAVEAVKRHFDCGELKGAELAVNKDGKMDHSHWSLRLFSDDIMASVLYGEQRLSELTLAILADSTWYEVNMAAAQPPITSGPDPHFQWGCDMAIRSWYLVRPAVTQRTMDGVVRSSPFCEHALTMNYCSDDGQVALECNEEKSAETFGTPYLAPMKPEANEPAVYPHCKKATKAAPSMDPFSLVGNNTMCLTVDLKNNKGFRPYCVRYLCKNDTLNLYLTGQNKETCNILCTRSVSKKLYNISIGESCQQEAGARGEPTVICPDVDLICGRVEPPSTSTPSTNGSVTGGETWGPGDTTGPGGTKPPPSPGQTHPTVPGQSPAPPGTSPPPGHTAAPPPPPPPGETPGHQKEETTTGAPPGAKVGLLIIHGAVVIAILGWKMM